MSGDNVWLVVCIVIALLYCVVLFWACYDAMSRYEFGCAGMGCIWPFLLITFPPALPFYIFMRFYSDRRVSRRILLERELERADAEKVPRFASDIHKLRYLAAADKAHGTLYDPTTGAGMAAEGYPHFADSRAEALLSQRRFDEAQEYLLDLYTVAAKDGDVRGRDTYRHYLSQIPGGLEALAQHEAQRSDLLTQYKQPGERSMPF
jgi:hypothetical protein